MNTKTINSFSVHPSVIKSIILEQAGDPCKALTELVMNSIDAGATQVDIELSSKGFKVTDDGAGFKSLESIVADFGTFGAPKKLSDAEFSKFRIGRGQVLGISSSVWRSGFFEMEVDLNGLQNRTDIGYLIKEHDVAVKGCEITGTFFSPLHSNEGYLNAAHFDNSLKESINAFKEVSEQKPENLVQLLTGSVSGRIKNRVFIRLFELLLLVKIPVLVNGVNITRMLPMKRLGSNSIADFYIFTKPSVNVGTTFLNKGVHIFSLAHPVPMIVDFKKQPNLNMARNSINKDCKIYQSALSYVETTTYEGMLTGEPYYKGLVNAISSALINSSSRFLIANSTSQYSMVNSYIPTNYTLSELDQILSIMRLNTISADDVKLSLLDLVSDFLTNPEDCPNKYKFVTENAVKQCGGIAEFKAKVSETIGDKILVYGVNGEQFNSRLFENLDYLYHCLGVSHDLEDVYHTVGQVDIESKASNPIFEKENGLLNYGCYKELNSNAYKKHENLKDFLHETVHEMRKYLQHNLGELSLHANNLLADNAPFEIKFMKIVGDRTNLLGKYNDVRYIHIDGQHIMIFDPTKILKKMQGLGSYEHYFNNSVAVDIYLAILNCHVDTNTPLSALHDLRKKNENFLFEGSSLRDDLADFDSKITKFIRIVKPATKKKAKSMQVYQEKIKLIKSFMDAELGGMTDDLALEVTKILAVEV